ncbi:MAG: epimerase [Bacteroidia bacterium]|nr:MAG: epimerase [Bacteroidia bacterium]
MERAIDNRDRTVAVTGGTGFIGSHTVEALLERGYKVRCLVRPGRATLGWLEGLAAHATPVNLFDRDAVRSALEGCEAVVHIAGVTRARRRADFFRGNVESTRAVLAASRDAGSVRSFCYISSLTAAGPSPAGAPVTEDSPCRPITSYGASKLEAERVCRSYEDAFRVIILRPPAVYGPRDGDILHMFRWIKFGFVPVMGPREKMLSVIYVTELAHAIVCALESAPAGSTYFVGDPEPYAYSTLAGIAASLLGKRTRNLPVPASLVYVVGAATQAVSWLLPQPSVVNIDKVRDLLAAHWICSTLKMRQELGFTPKVQAQEGLRRTLAWYREKGWL